MIKRLGANPFPTQLKSPTSETTPTAELSAPESDQVLGVGLRVLEHDEDVGVGDVVGD